MTAATYLFFGFVGGVALREIARFWVMVWRARGTPVQPVDRWGQVHIDGDRRAPFIRRPA